MISTRPASGAPIVTPPSPWSLASLRLKQIGTFRPIFGERDRCRRNQRNALVGGPEQQIERDTRCQDGLGVELRPAGAAHSPSLNRPALKKYGESRPALVLNSPKRSTCRANGELDELLPKSRFSVIVTVRIITLNLNGIRSAVNKGCLRLARAHRRPTSCAFRRSRRRVPDLTRAMRDPSRLRGYFHFARAEGLQRRGPLLPHASPTRWCEGFGIPDIDAEGRYLEARFGNLSVVSFYVPSGSSSEERLAIKFSFLERAIAPLHDVWRTAGATSSSAATGTLRTRKSI